MAKYIKIKDSLGVEQGRFQDGANVNIQPDWNQTDNTNDDFIKNKPDVVLQNEKGSNNGVATLDNNGIIPTSQLPSYVDDVLEFADFASLPVEGEGGKIYITLDDNKTFRWSGTTYTEISASIALGETLGTAYEGSKGKTNADNITALTTRVTDLENSVPEIATDTNTGVVKSSNDEAKISVAVDGTMSVNGITTTTAISYFEVVNE